MVPPTITPHLAPYRQGQALASFVRQDQPLQASILLMTQVIPHLAPYRQGQALASFVRLTVKFPSQ